jgi:hypothetical protein
MLPFMKAGGVIGQMPKNRRKPRNEKTGSATKSRKNAQRGRGIVDCGQEMYNRRKIRFSGLE